MALLVLCLLLTLLAVPFLADRVPTIGGAKGAERQGEASQCVAIGTNWTGCENVSASDDIYATADPTGVASFIRAGGISGTSFSLDIGSPGTGRLVVVLADDESKGTSLTDVTVDANSCNKVTEAENSAGGGNHQEMWYCDEDDLGSSSGSVPIAVGGGDDGWAVHAQLYTEVSQAGPTDIEIENTAGPVSTIEVEFVTVPASGVVVFGAAHGSAGSFTSWTSPLLERTDGPNPDSARFGTAGGTEASSQTNKTYVATASVAFTRGTGIVAVWPSSGAGESDTTWLAFGLQLGPQDSVDRVEVGVEWYRLSVSSILNVTITWDGGLTWAPNQTATNKSGDDDTAEFLDFTSATAWDPARLSDASLRVRVGTNYSGARMDYLAVRVNYKAAPRVSDLRLEDGAGMSRAGEQLEVGTEYRFLFNVSDEGGWSDIGVNGSISLRLWYDGNVTPELTYGAQTNGSGYRIELRYADTLDPGNASVNEWSVIEGDASYNAAASSATVILSGSLVVGFAFNLAVMLGNQIGGTSDPTNATPGAYNDPDSWNVEIVTTDVVAVVTHRTAVTGEHMEFGVFPPVPIFSPVLRLDRSGAERGDVVLAILYFNNTGTGPALRAWANWSLGGYYVLVDILPAQTYSVSSEGFDIWLTDVDPGAHSLVARLRVIRGLEDGLAMQVRITWEVTDGNGIPLPGGGDVGVVTLLAPILAVDLRASDTSVQVGSEFVLDMTVENTGRADGSGWLNMTLPPGAAFVSQDGTLEVTTSAGLVSWRIASLAPTDQIHIQLRLRVNEGPSLESFVLAVAFTDGEGSPPLTVFSSQVFVRFLGSGAIPLPSWIFLLPLLIPAIFAAYYVNRRLRHPELRIQEVFVIHRKGILVAHQSRTLTPDTDRDVLAAMFKTVQGFVQEAFARGTEGSMRALRFENFNILIEQGTYHYVAVVYQGRESRLLARRVAMLSQSIEAEFGALLAAWVGDMNEIRGIRHLLPLIWGESAPFAPREAPQPALRAPSPVAPTPRAAYRSLPDKPVWWLPNPVRTAHRLLRATSMLMRDQIGSKERVLRRITAMARAAIGRAIGFVRGPSRHRPAP